MDRDAVRAYVARLDKAANRPLAEQLEDDVGQYRGLTMEQRAQTVEGLIRSGWQVLRSRPDFEKANAWEDPPSADLEEIWRRLMARRAQLASGANGR
jgi:hypothetical protein